MEAAALLPPDRTLDQRMDALAKANTIRSENSRLKRDLKAGQISFREALDKESCQSAKISAIVSAAPGIGPSKARQAFAQTGISSMKHVGALTPGARARLIEWVERKQKTR